MRALWHLAISSFAGRVGRTVLLALAVGLATALGVGVAAAVGTMARSMEHVVGRVAGLADLSVEHRFGGRLPTGLLDEVRSWPQVDLASGQAEGGATFRLKRTGRQAPGVLRGVEPQVEERLNPSEFIAGRAVRADGEVVLDRRLRRDLGAEVGDAVEIVRPGAGDELTVVGIVERPGLGAMRRPLAIAPLALAQAPAGQAGGLDEIRIRLRPGLDAATWAEAHQARLPAEAVFRTPASGLAGVNRQLRLVNLLFHTVTVVASLSSAFLIVTSLTTAVTQRMREMAILRCIGASRRQLACAQVAAGGLIGLLGATLGTPLGLLAAYGLYRRFEGFLPGGFSANPEGLAVAAVGSLLAGLLGAAYPAVLAAAARPLEALTVRARPPARRHVAVCAAAGLALGAMQPAAMVLSGGREWGLWFGMCAGVPAMFLGYFLLSVPGLVLAAWTAAPLAGRLLRLPAAMLRQTLLATPMRQGFTAGTLMVGLAVLVAVWTEGHSVMVGWFDTIRMPDAFVYRVPSLSDEQWRALRQTAAVARACATATFPVRPAGRQAGITGLVPPSTLFVGADMPLFLSMTDLDWYEGSADSALRRLAAGRALLVTREWSIAQGLGVGGTLALETAKGPVAFEVAGVIGSKGLDLAAHALGIWRRFREASLSSVFGTRQDAETYFGVRGVNLVLVSLRDDVADDEAVRQLMQAAPGSAVGTSREVRRRVGVALDRQRAVAAALAVGSLVLACLGVGSLIVAEVASRRFEFGVLRAVGAPKALLGRLVAGQTLIVAMVGCVAGTALGVEISQMARFYHRRLAGIDYAMHLPGGVIASGALAVAAAALLAALPAIWRLMRVRPSALLARRE